MKERIIFIVGPTASRKTEVAVYLAKKINGEIISCDSMQVYRCMDILTSKPAPSLRRKIPHHLISAISPQKPYNVSKYRVQAIKKVKEILKKGKTPLFVGGTGLYMSIVIDGIFKLKSFDKNCRLKLENEAAASGSTALHQRLKQVDPLAASKIHPNDAKRIIRALEVIEVTGQPISQLQKERKGLGDAYTINSFCLDMERGKLYQRIDERVEKMFKKGLVEEVRKLLKLRLSRTAASAIGIKELKGYFDGAYDLEEAKRLIKRSTRLYAKRQLTWFRKDKRIQWINIGAGESAENIANKILKKLKK
jgi:tRNA dimethylallyltransferase